MYENVSPSDSMTSWISANGIVLCAKIIKHLASDFGLSVKPLEEVHQKCFEMLFVQIEDLVMSRL